MRDKNIQSIYKQNQLLSASPKEVVLLLYEECVKSLRRAEIALDQKKLDFVNDHLKKAQDILWELDRHLDKESGLEISRQLELLYEYFLHELFQANLKKDKRRIQLVRKNMQELADTWRIL